MSSNTSEIKSFPAAAPRTSGIRARRVALGLSQNFLALAATISKHAILVAEKGDAPPIVYQRLDAALVCIERGGTLEDARQVSGALRPPRAAPVRQKKPLPEHSPCKQCGGDVPKARRRSIADWLAQAYCSPECREATLRGEAGWPVLTTDLITGTPFAAHDRDPGDGGARRLARPETHVASASTLG